MIMNVYFKSEKRRDPGVHYYIQILEINHDLSLKTAQLAALL